MKRKVITITFNGNLIITLRDIFAYFFPSSSSLPQSHRVCKYPNQKPYLISYARNCLNNQCLIGKTQAKLNTKRDDSAANYNQIFNDSNKMFEFISPAFFWEKRIKNYEQPTEQLQPKQKDSHFYWPIAKKKYEECAAVPIKMYLCARRKC